MHNLEARHAPLDPVHVRSRLGGHEPVGPRDSREPDPVQAGTAPLRCCRGHYVADRGVHDEHRLVRADQAGGGDRAVED